MNRSVTLNVMSGRGPDPNGVPPIPRHHAPSGSKESQAEATTYTPRIDCVGFLFVSAFGEGLPGLRLGSMGVVGPSRVLPGLSFARPTERRAVGLRRSVLRQPGFPLTHHQSASASDQCRDPKKKKAPQLDRGLLCVWGQMSLSAQFGNSMLTIT
jgi:hypothetical protein